MNSRKSWGIISTMTENCAHKNTCFIVFSDWDLVKSLLMIGAKGFIKNQSSAGASLTVLDWLNVIVTISGQNWLWPQIYPKVVVYPSGVCTYDKGSFGAPWWSPGTPSKTPLFSVINLCPSLPHPGGIFGWSIWGTYIYPNLFESRCTNLFLMSVTERTRFLVKRFSKTTL